MNWTDFMIAIRQGLIPSKKELVDGTTTVGNSKTLDGKTASEFFPRTVNKTGVDFNDLIDLGFCMVIGNAEKPLKNAPRNYANGNFYVLVFKWGASYLRQIVWSVRNDTNGAFFIRNYFNGVWETEWSEYSPNGKVDAKTLDGKTASEVGESGARNLIPYPYEKTTSTYSGITWTDNGDGTFTANGTTESTSLFNSKPFVLEAGTYRLSGSPLMHSTGSSVNGGITLRYADNGSGIGNYDVGFGSAITLTQKTTVIIRLVVQSVFGEANNLTFRPMLELGSVAHDFVPYHFGGAEKAKSADWAEWAGNANNAKTVNGFAVYTDVSQLGIASYNVIDISNAMPVNSKFIASVVSGYTYAEDTTNLLPSNNGVLEITKSANAKRRNIVFYSGGSTSKDNVYICDIDENANTIDGWKHIGDGGNAKTLDGHGAEYFAPKTDLANYLPKSGDVSLSGLFDIQGRNTVIDPLRITSNHPTDDRNLIEFKLRGSAVGYLGFNGASNPVFMHAGNGACYPLLHTGNSAKVHIGSSAPSDTTSLWIDTSA